MSLIHEALEKIEREKTQKTKFLAPKFAIQEPKPKEPAVHSWTVYGIVGILFLSLLLGLVFLLHSSQNPNMRHLSSGISHPAISRQPSWNAEEDFVLTGITQIGEDRTAILNNLLVHPGDEIDGAVVEAIETDKVVLRLGKQIINLSLHNKQGTHFTQLKPVH